MHIYWRALLNHSESQMAFFSLPNARRHIYVPNEEVAFGRKELENRWHWDSSHLMLWVSLSSWTSLAFCFLMCQVGTIYALHGGNTEIINVCKLFQNPMLEVRYQEYKCWWSWKVQMHKTILLFCYKQILVRSFINKITFSSTFKNTHSKDAVYPVLPLRLPVNYKIPENRTF